MLNKRVVRKLLFLSLVIASAGSLLSNQTANPPLSQHVFFRVKAAASVQGPLNGRLLIFVKKGSGDTSVDTDEFRPQATWVAAEGGAGSRAGRIR